MAKNDNKSKNTEAPSKEVKKVVKPEVTGNTGKSPETPSKEVKKVVKPEGTGSVKADAKVKPVYVAKELIANFIGEDGDKPKVVAIGERLGKFMTLASNGTKSTELGEAKNYMTQLVNLLKTAEDSDFITILPRILKTIEDDIKTFGQDSVWSGYTYHRPFGGGVIPESQLAELLVRLSGKSKRKSEIKTINSNVIKGVLGADRGELFIQFCSE